MNKLFFTASQIRHAGYTIDPRIPDHAIISSTDVRYESISRPSRTSSLVTSVLNVPRFDYDKFVWYRFPPKTRLLVSRNKREGRYLGWRKLGPMKRGESWSGGKKPGHQRIGSELRVTPLSLKAIQR